MKTKNIPKIPQKNSFEDFFMKYSNKNNKNLKKKGGLKLINSNSNLYSF